MKRKILCFLSFLTVKICFSQTISGGWEHSLFICSDSTVKACGSNQYGELSDSNSVGWRVSPIQLSAPSGIIMACGGYFNSLFLKSDGTVWQVGNGYLTPTLISGLSGIISIASGDNFSLFLKNDGTVWALGENNLGQLGNGSTLPNTVVAQVIGLSGIVAIAAGSEHSLFLKNDSTVWACGRNYEGQLGDWTNTERDTATQIFLSGIKAISAGYGFSLFLKANGTVLACGHNSYGELGDGTQTWRNYPSAVPSLSGISAIAAGYQHSLFLKNDSTVWGCGWNSGTLGDATTTTRLTPVQVSGLTGIISIRAGMEHSMFLKKDSTVWACGRNTFCQVGDGTNTMRTTAAHITGAPPTVVIGAGHYQSYYLDSNGNIWDCGQDNDYQLGDARRTERDTVVTGMALSGIVKVASSPVGDFSVFLKNDGTAWACGNNFSGNLGDGTTSHRAVVVQVNLSNVIDIAIGGSHTLFLKNDGTAWSCGFNAYGELGDGTQNQRLTPVQVTALSGIISISANEYHSLFLKNDGTVWGCGQNYDGELGDGTSGTVRYLPVQVAGLTGIVSISAGENFSLFVKNDGTAWACGYNNYGQLGDGTTTSRSTAVQVLGLTGITKCRGGGNHSLFLKNDGTVWACGSNSNGQLSDGTQIDRLFAIQNLVSNVDELSAGALYSLFQKNDGTVWGCGNNNYGELGDGTTRDYRTTPVQVLNLCNALSPCAVPVMQANSITFSNNTSNSVTVHWLNGNGSRRIVKIKPTNSFTSPVNGNDYIANSVYNGSGEQVVYNGTGSSVNVTGLSPYTFYWFKVYEANCSGNSSSYISSNANHNPRRIRTTYYMNPNRPETEETEEIDDNLFVVYPNPTSSSITIESSTDNLIDKVNVSSIDGRVVKSFAVAHSSSVNIDMDGLSAGVYFLDCFTEKGNEKVKVVKY